jgi:hypothetical protein
VSFRDETRFEVLPVLVKKITAKAVLINLGEAGDHWVPQSCIATDSLTELCEGFLGDVHIAEWFVRKEGLMVG